MVRTIPTNSRIQWTIFSNVLAVILKNFIFLTMGLKKVSAKDSDEKKQMMCIELKKDLIKVCM